MYRECIVVVKINDAYWVDVLVLEFSRFYALLWVLPNNVYLCDIVVVLIQNWCKNYWSEYIKMYTNPVLKLKIDTQK